MNEPTLEYPYIEFEHRDITVVLQMTSKKIYLCGWLRGSDVFYHPIQLKGYKGKLSEKLSSAEFELSSYLFPTTDHRRTFKAARQIKKTDYFGFGASEFAETYDEYLERIQETVINHIDQTLEKYEAHKKYFETELNG